MLSVSVLIIIRSFYSAGFYCVPVVLKMNCSWKLFFVTTPLLVLVECFLSIICVGVFVETGNAERAKIALVQADSFSVEKQNNFYEFIFPLSR